MARVKKPVPRTNVHPKVTAAGGAGVAATVVTYVAQKYFGFEVDPVDALAVGSALMVFAGWFKAATED